MGDWNEYVRKEPLTDDEHEEVVVDQTVGEDKSIAREAYRKAKDEEAAKDIVKDKEK